MTEIFNQTEKSNSKVEKMLDLFDREGVALHSLLVARGNDIVSEIYYSPFTRDSLHRMYSVTKSINALGIGILLKKGLLALDDGILSFFDEYASDMTDERIRRTSVRNLLEMKSPFSKTCYKEGARNSSNVSTYQNDWIASFFTLKPDHEPGSFFSYDTGSATVLSKIIEKVSGRSYIDFFKHELFNFLDISEKTYILSDPAGNPQGGSGLMMRPLDLLKIIYLVSKGGLGLIDPGYLRDAASPISDTAIASISSLKERRLGYGYQIWCTGDSYAFIGLGGQLALAVPSKDLLFVTTADTQVYDSYSQLLLKALLRLSEEIDINEVCEKKERAVVSLENRRTGKLQKVKFRMDDNPLRISSVSLRYDEEEGNITLVKDGETISYDFFFGKNKVIPIREASSSPALASASLNRDDTLSIWLQFIGECNGGLTFEIAIRKEHLSMRMRLYGELMFDGYSGVLTGIKV